MLKPFAEIMLSFGNVREAVVLPAGATEDNLLDIANNGVSDGNRVMYFKLDEHGLQYENGTYDVTVDVFEDGKPVLYNLEGAEVENLGADTIKITITGIEKK